MKSTVTISCGVLLVLDFGVVKLIGELYSSSWYEHFVSFGDSDVLFGIVVGGLYGDVVDDIGSWFVIGGALDFDLPSDGQQCIINFRSST